MTSAKFIKGILAAAALNLVLFFPSAATPLLPHSSPATSLTCTSHHDAMDTEWRIYDINGDGRFDIDDIDEYKLTGGIGFVNDLNTDGHKDLTDVFALYIKLAVLDRNCDESVDDEDFTPIDQVTLPEPDASFVWPLVSRIVTEAGMKLPADIELQVFRSLPLTRPLSPPEKAYILEITGMSALLQLNLEGARWAFGRAYQTNKRSATALGSLGFTMAMDKRHEEALALLSLARKLNSKSGATSTSIAWVFARHGQNDEALSYYLEAVESAPDIAHYHLNLGIAYMRVGDTEKAGEQFRIAAELDPGDFHGMIFGYTVPEKMPPGMTPVDINKLKEEDLLQINEFRESGATEDELPTPWNECSPCEQARKIPELLERRDDRKYASVAQSYADEMATKRNEWGVANAPQFKKSSADLQRWNAWRSGNRALMAEEIEAENALGNLTASLARQRGNEIMGYSSFFMKCALEQAEINARIQSEYDEERLKNLPISIPERARLKTEAYNSALEEAIKECYIDPMLTGASLLNAVSSPQQLPHSEVEVLDLTFFYPLVWLDACLSIKGYADGGEPQNAFGIADNTFSLNLWVASFEYNWDSGEWELRILPGTGIILGATWSPESSFGFQAGVDLGLDLEIAGINLEGYFEVNKTGMTLNGEAGVFVSLGVLEAGLETSGSASVIPFQATTSEPLPEFVRD
jgi:tetratricopeptide (TPR) repeat protein